MKDMTKLVKRAKSGDRDAFAKLYELTKDKAYFVAARYVSDEADIADVLSDAYIAAMESMSSFDAGKAFEPWLHTIVRNKAIDLLRKRKPISVDNDGVLDIEDAESMLSAEYIESEEKRRVILSIIDKLPQAQKITVNLFYLEGLSVNEISEIMSCPPSTVTSRLQYARKSIREAVLMEEKKTGDKLYGVAGTPFLAEVLKREMDSGFYKMPSAMSAQVSSGISAASVAVGGTVASTVGIGAKIMALSVGAKVAVSVGAAIVLAAGVGIPAYISNENEKATVMTMAIIQQQEDEQSRIEAVEMAAKLEADRIESERVRVEEEKAAAEKAEAERIEAVRIEEERVRAEEEAKAAAEEAARIEEERIAAEQAAIAAQQAQQAAIQAQVPATSAPAASQGGGASSAPSGLPEGGKLVEGELKPGDKVGNITIVGDGESRRGSSRQG